MENILGLGTLLSDMLGTQTTLLSFSQTAAATLITAAWQGAVIAIGLLFCLRLTPQVAAAHRFALWAAGFSVIVSLPFMPLLEHLVLPSSSRAVMNVSPSPAATWMQLDARWSLILVALWAIASLFRAIDLCVHSVQLRRLWKSALPVSLPAGCAPLPLIAGRKSIELCTSTRLERPSVIGFLAPRILIPEWLFEQLTPAELDQIMLHESEHLRRLDDWTNLIQKLGLVLFPLNPALLWIERQLCLEREIACDDGVIRRTNSPRAYAACLTNLAERSLRRRTGDMSQGTLSLGAWQHRSELARRVHSVLRHKRALGSLGARSLLAGFGFSLVFGAVELARCPQLIVFVPSRDGEISIAHGNTAFLSATLRTRRQTENDAQERISSLVSDRASSHPRVTYLKAELSPRQGHNAAAAARASTHAAKIAPPSSNVPMHQQRIIQTQFLDDESELKSELPQTQTWVVLTTWEQVERPSQIAAESEDDSLSAGQQAKREIKSETEQPAVQQSGQPTGRFMITRLVIRVLPANYSSPSPATGFSHAGWLLFQL